MSVDIIAQSSEVLAGTFLARAVYGAEYIAPAYWVGGDGDAERNDDYRGYVESQGSWQLLDASDLPTFNDRGGDAGFTPNGLYNARVDAGITNTFDAQGLLAIEGGDTLVMTFRGTDGEDPAVITGQAFTGFSVAAHYKGLRPMINAAYDYLQDHPEIAKIVVSGHSLGGAMADVFALKDAARFRDLRPDGLTIVSLASSGVPDDLPVYMNNLDADAANIGTRTIELAPFIEIDVPYIKGLVLPGDYISISNSEDRAHFPQNYPDVPEEPGLVPIATLKSNLHFGGDTIFDLPNIENNDVQYYDILEHPFDFRGMGAEHNSSLLWTNLQAVLTDDLRGNYHAQNLIVGVADYTSVPDFNGDPISLFEGYLDLDNPRDDDDRGTRPLLGTVGNDYILGLSGNDNLQGGLGRDLLSGGSGRDVLRGDAGDDKISGGTGRDRMIGGADADVFQFSSVDDSPRRHADVIVDFGSLDGDFISLRRIDACESLGGNQNFDFIGTQGFSDEGQVRAIQVGSDTLLKINTTGTGGAEMDILLKNVVAAGLAAVDFIL
ncbi:MAG: hypothetical protein KDK75_02075 [Alphaproteobacteria bacterium]|nr:hypothetical protein [Alphaproteobacteria bacterium]